MKLYAVVDKRRATSSERNGERMEKRMSGRDGEMVWQNG